MRRWLGRGGRAPSFRGDRRGAGKGHETGLLDCGGSPDPHSHQGDGVAFVAAGAGGERSAVPRRWSGGSDTGNAGDLRVCEPFSDAGIKSVSSDDGTAYVACGFRVRSHPCSCMRRSSRCFAIRPAVVDENSRTTR